MASSDCVNYDLCESCEAVEGVHDPTHILLKIRIPLERPAAVKLVARFDPGGAIVANYAPPGGADYHESHNGLVFS